MVSPTPNRGYTYPAHGGAVGAWDTPLNTNFDYIDLNVGGYYGITASTTTAANTFNSSYATIASTARSITVSASLAQNLFYRLDGTLTSSLAINMPAAGGIYVFANALTVGSSYDVVAQPTGGSGVTLVSGGQGIVVMTSTGANYAANAVGSFLATSLTVSSAVEFTGTNKMGVPKGTTGQRPGSPVSGDVRYNSTLNGLEYYNGTAWIILGQATTVQKFTSGSGNCTPSTGVVRWRVRMCAGGGGGGARVSNNGSNGTATTFGSWSANPGSGGGASASAQGPGGSGGSDGTGTLIVRIPGGSGNAGGISNNAGINPPGGSGGSNPFAGNGNASVGGGSGSVVANTGAGGAGGGSNGAANGGSGGGAGEYVEFWVNNPTVTAYSVGPGGNGGTAGGTAGAAGAAGVIIIEEFYA